MSYFQTPSDPRQEEPAGPLPPADSWQPYRSPGSRLADWGDRIARTFEGLGHGRVQRVSLEPREPARLGPDGGLGPDEAGLALDEAGLGPDEEAGLDQAPTYVPGAESEVRFPIDPMGYERAAVDQYIAELEQQLAQLKQSQPPMSITEEIERLGEQTASILVVAHDQAHETARLAREEADRRVAEAAANAVAITERARLQLGELDQETDVVWRERTRLLEDARAVGVALVGLADEAVERFPAEAVERFPATAPADCPEPAAERQEGVTA